MAKLDLAKARELLKAAMETQGRDFVYQIKPGSGCYNAPVDDSWWPDCPWPADSPKRITGCLVGTAMKLAGVDVAMREAYRGGTVGVAFGHLLTEEAICYLAVAQDKQDNGSPWGEAFDAAERWAFDNVRALAGV